MNRKKVLVLILIFSFLLSVNNVTWIYAKDESDLQLYAQSAVLMDADSGRILLEKNGQEIRPMASTTKIMTCILALEYGKFDDVVTFSSAAASQPQVRLGAPEGEQFLLRDLLYSLMLESHNDTAVAIAERISGSADQFAALMNGKARELGCQATYFITPNGLDASDQQGNPLHNSRGSGENYEVLHRSVGTKGPVSDDYTGRFLFFFRYRRSSYLPMLQP